MRIPQVSERVKEAPAQALRAVFSGIGQFLLVTDRLKNRSAGPEQVPRPRAAGPHETAVPAGQPSPAPAESAPPAPAAEAPPANTSVAAAPSAEAPAATSAAAEAPAAKSPAAKAPAAKAPAAKAPAAKAPAAKAPAAKSPAAKTPPATAPAEPPLPNYSELSVASLRARMRGLTLEQVRELIEHERATTGREDVIAMFERRLAKLEAETREG